MFCNNCNKEIEPELGETSAGNCIYQEFRCPKHHNVLKSGFKRTEPLIQKNLIKISKLLKSYKLLK